MKTTSGSPPETTFRIPPKVGGIPHLLAAAHYSYGGFRRLIKETAARLELAAGAVAILLLSILGATWTQIAAFAILFLLLLAIEALNTAIEVLTNRISPEWSLEAKHAKDLGSLAVAILIGANAVCFSVIFLSLLG